MTDSDGRASVQRLSGDMCTISAFDPAGLFFSETTEFGCQNSSVTIILRVRPIIDKVDVSDSAELKITIDGPNGIPLPNQSVLVRPAATSFEAGEMFTETADSSGTIIVRLSSGSYVVAALVGEKPYEAELLVTTGEQKCPKSAQNCLSLTTRSRKERSIVLHLRAKAAAR